MSETRWRTGAVLTACVLSAGLAAKAAPARPALLGIAHIQFKVTDRAAARRFYEDRLGLPISPLDRTGTLDRVTINARQRILVEPGLPAGVDERLDHVAFETADVEALAVFLSAKGVTVSRDPRPCGGALRVVDPDGHTLEFVQRPEARTPVADAPRALSRRILHAGLTVRDEARAHAFYRDVLGFSEIWRGGAQEGVTSWVNMRLPESTDYVEYMLVDGRVDRRRLGSLHHACLLVPDIQDAWEIVYARTPAAERGNQSPPQIGRNRRWQLNLFDPDGTRVELMEPHTVR